VRPQKKAYQTWQAFLISILFQSEHRPACQRGVTMVVMQMDVETFYHFLI
jgi:hypothetical protein